MYKIKFLSLIFLGMITFFTNNVFSSDIKKNTLYIQDDSSYVSNNIKHKILISQIVEHPALNQTRQGIIDELKENGYADDNVDIRYESAQGNMIIANQIAEKFVSQKPSIIVALGTNMAQNFIQYAKKGQATVIFSSITDPLGAKLVDDLAIPNKNITGVSNYISSQQSLKLLKEIMPEVKDLGIIYSNSEINSVKLIADLKNEAKFLDINIIEAIANKTSDVSVAAESIINSVDAIYINNDNTALSAFQSIVKLSYSTKKPIFVSDNDIVKQGALASLGPDQYELGRQTALMIIKVLKGIDVKSIPVEFPKKIDFYFNKKVMDKLELKINPEIYNKADLVIE